ncbi:MAG: ATP-binding protein [Verrucomicrobiia bacterium]
MLERSARLPPRSFLLFILLMRDVTGVTHNADEALPLIRAVANAPINGIFQHQLGLGIVGGRLYQAELEGVKAARIAVRILQGEPASSFPPQIVPPLPPRYDWRELRRWSISEDRLPPSSLILFRQPTVWQQNRGWIISGVVVFIMQALLIFALWSNLVRRHRAELELRQQRHELAHVSRLSTMGELSASIAHELNQPLAAILSNAQAALRGLGPSSPNVDELREILKDIADATKRAGELIRRVRALLKKGEPQFSELFIDEVIRDVSALLHADIASRNGRVEFELAASLPVVRGDPIQVQQVLVNLTLNAFDAMKALPAANRRAVISARPEGGHGLRLSVRDYGGGIPPEKLETVFESFYTTKSEGLGMGLAVARSIVEAHKGRIWAENHPDGGAVFHLTLPAAHPRQG